MGTLSILSALMGIGTGIWQLFKGNQAADTERPEYEIPEEATKALGIAKQGAYSDMPGYEQAISNLQQSGASQFSRASESASSGGDLLGFLAAQGVTSNRGLNQLAAQNAAYKVGAEDKYRSALNYYAQLRNQEFQTNEMQPYLDAMRTSSVMTEGGIQNIFGGITGGIQNYAAINQMKSYQDLVGSQKTYYDMQTEQKGQQVVQQIPPNYFQGSNQLTQYPQVTTPQITNQQPFNMSGYNNGMYGGLLDSYGMNDYYNYFQ